MYSSCLDRHCWCVSCVEFLANLDCFDYAVACGSYKVLGGSFVDYFEFLSLSPKKVELK